MAGEVIQDLKQEIISYEGKQKESLQQKYVFNCVLQSRQNENIFKYLLILTSTKY